MTDEIIKTDEARKASKKTAKKINSNGCQCKGDNPVLEFLNPMATMDGKATLQGVYCPICYVVQQWARVPNDIKEPVERPVKNKAKEEASPSAVTPGVEPKGKPTVPKTTEEVTEQLKKSISVQQVKDHLRQPENEELSSIANQPVHATSTLEDVQQIHFPIASVNPVQGKPDHVAFMCTKNGLPFTIIIKNSVEKVTAAVNNPNNYVGKYVELEYSQVDENGFPKGYKMKALKNKSELPAISN